MLADLWPSQSLGADSFQNRVDPISSRGSCLEDSRQFSCHLSEMIRNKLDNLGAFTDIKLVSRVAC